MGDPSVLSAVNEVCVDGSMIAVSAQVTEGLVLVLWETSVIRSRSVRGWI